MYKSIWMAKFTVSEYLRRLTSTFWTRAHQRVLLGIRVFLVATFFAVVIATLGECQPFDHYWQVVPDPGPDCRSGYAQLFVMSVCDIITDILLILFPISIIARSAMPFRRKLSICVLFALSIILIVITAYRVSAIVLSGGRQQLRTLWASLEILAAAAVSNALILGSFVRDRGVKKSKYKAPAGAITTDATVEPQSNLVRKMTARHWGNDSDENLFASVRGRLDSVCTADASMIPAPLSAGLSVGSRPFSPRYRDDIPSISEVDGLVEPEEASEAVELMDVGGILSDDPKESTSTSVRKVSDDSRAPPGSAPWIASSSRDFVDSPTTDTKFDFADVGGLLSPRAERPAAALSVTSAPRQLAAPGHTFSSMAPVRAPPLRKNPSTLSGTSDMSLAPRRSSVASSQMTDESNGDSQAIALDMLAKIKAARAERTRQTLQRNDSYNMAGGGQGRLFGESGPSVGLFQPPQPD